MKRIIKRALAVVLCVCLFLTSAFCFSVSAGAVDIDDLWDILGDVISVSESKSDAEFTEKIIGAIGSRINPAYEYITYGLADALERQHFVQDMIYDPNEGAFENVGEWGVAVLDKAAGIAYTLTTQYELVKLYINAAGKIYDAVVVDDKSDLQFSPSVLAGATADYADRYGPKNTAEYISWRTDKRNYGGTYGTGYNYVPLSFRADGCFCGNDSWVLDVYLVPFYFSTDYYYGTYQYHYYVYFDKDEDGNYILDDNGRRIGYIKCDYYNMTVTDSPVNTAIITDNYYTYPYLDIPAVYTTTYNLWRWKTVTDYISISHNTANYRYFYLDNISDIGFASYVSDDFTDMVYVSGDMCDGGAFYGAVSAHDADCSNMCDIGYYCSNEPIKMKLDVDWSKFAADDVVTLSGDTIYDCVITNNNGDTSTINEYITNNYTYITNNGGGEGGGSGSSSGGAVGGNVTVGGNIDVGGSVDVNVNVNGGSGDSMPVDVDLDNYLAQTPEQAQPITQFISIFFDFLPPELLGLICLGVAVAIILRIWGR